MIMKKVKFPKGEKYDSDLNPYACTIVNDFELYNVHREYAEIETWSILSTKLNILNIMENS